MSSLILILNKKRSETLVLKFEVYNITNTYFIPSLLNSVVKDDL
jgi:hypothetical protein